MAGELYLSGEARTLLEAADEVGAPIELVLASARVDRWPMARRAFAAGGPAGVEALRTLRRSTSPPRNGLAAVARVLVEALGLAVREPQTRQPRRRGG